MAKKRVGFFGASGSLSGSGIHNALTVCERIMPSVIPHRIISCNHHGGVAAVADTFGVPFYHFPFDGRHSVTAWRQMWEVCDIEYLVLLGCTIRVVGLSSKVGQIINEPPALLSVHDWLPP